MKKFDWIDFHKTLHESTNPQCASVNEKNEKGGIVRYTFYPNPIDPQTGRRVWFIIGLNPAERKRGLEDKVQQAMGFISALGAIYPSQNLHFAVHRDYDSGMIETMYQTKSKKELEKITAYLRTVPEEGKMPKKDAELFIYD